MNVFPFIFLKTFCVEIIIIIAVLQETTIKLNTVKW